MEADTRTVAQLDRISIYHPLKPVLLGVCGYWGSFKIGTEGLEGFRCGLFSL